MASFTEQISIAARPDKVWQLLSDIGNIYQWNPGVDDSYVTSDQSSGAGASRRCELKGKNYLDEEVVRWEPCEKLTMRITETNLPFKNADIHFELMGQNGRTIVTLNPVYKLKFGFIGRLLDVLFVRKTYREGMKDLLKGLKERAEAMSE